MATTQLRRTVPFILHIAGFRAVLDFFIGQMAVHEEIKLPADIIQLTYGLLQRLSASGHILSALSEA